MPKRSIESYGVGQSGYTAGRKEDDPSLDLEDRNHANPASTEEDESDGLGVDERFVGAGGRRWVPEPESKTDDKE